MRYPSTAGEFDGHREFDTNSFGRKPIPSAEIDLLTDHRDS